MHQNMLYLPLKTTSSKAYKARMSNFQWISCIGFKNRPPQPWTCCIHLGSRQYYPYRQRSISYLILIRKNWYRWLKICATLKTLTEWLMDIPWCERVVYKSDTVLSQMMDSAYLQKMLHKLLEIPSNYFQHNENPKTIFYWYFHKISNIVNK